MTLQLAMSGLCFWPPISQLKERKQTSIGLHQITGSSMNRRSPTLAKRVDPEAVLRVRACNRNRAADDSECVALQEDEREKSGDSESDN